MQCHNPNFQQHHRIRSVSMVLTLKPAFRCIPAVVCLHLLPLQAQHESGIFSPGCWRRLSTMPPLLPRTRSVLRLTRTAWLCDFLQMGTGEWGDPYGEHWEHRGAADQWSLHIFDPSKVSVWRLRPPHLPFWEAESGLLLEQDAKESTESMKLELLETVTLDSTRPFLWSKDIERRKPVSKNLNICQFFLALGKLQTNHHHPRTFAKLHQQSTQNHRGSVGHMRISLFENMEKLIAYIRYFMRSVLICLSTIESEALWKLGDNLPFDPGETLRNYSNYSVPRTKGYYPCSYLMLIHVWSWYARVASQLPQTGM